jgi:uncharacterized protein (DUF924 family)
MPSSSGKAFLAMTHGRRISTAARERQSVLQFWFQESSRGHWWTADAEYDRLIVERFAELHARASRSELFEWRREPRGRLAEIIVLDQFSRNIYRGDARAYANDTVALALAQEAVTAEADRTLGPEERVFLYMPFMHSESRLIHEVAERLFKECGPKSNYEFELRHKAIIDRFGRYPHRNITLGRQSTAEELAFLAEPGSSF